jgi:tetratricopeptide (TPR) repeat protein
MKKIVLLFCFAILATAGGADQTDQRLIALFDELRSAQDARDASHIDAGIWAIWYETNDQQATEILEAATAFMTQGDYPAALRELDALVARNPEFAEGWNMRATVLYLNGDYQESLRDIDKTLSLEPRHFGALSGRGLCYLHLGELAEALKAFEAALQIHPWLPGARTHVERIRERLATEQQQSI